MILTIELKNSLTIKGKLTFVDNNMNFNLVEAEAEDQT
jgi:small nuclear ribonucleoprotein (snRNP)-like protein